jgi:hypothetical protein
VKGSEAKELVAQAMREAGWTGRLGTSSSSILTGYSQWCDGRVESVASCLVMCLKR